MPATALQRQRTLKRQRKGSAQGHSGAPCCCATRPQFVSSHIQAIPPAVPNLRLLFNKQSVSAGSYHCASLYTAGVCATCAGRQSVHHTQSLLQQGHEQTPFLCQHASVSELHLMCHSRSCSHLCQIQLQQYHSMHSHCQHQSHVRVRQRLVGCRHFLPNRHVQLSVLHSRMQPDSRVVSLNQPCLLGALQQCLDVISCSLSHLVSILHCALHQQLAQALL